MLEAWTVLGGCHCGNIHVRLRLTKPPEDNLLRACTCSFCRSHNPRMLSDPEGSFEVRADDWSLVERYRFGTRTCDFLICRRCGVFIAAVAELSEGVRAVVNVNCLDDRRRQSSGLLERIRSRPLSCAAESPHVHSKSGRLAEKSASQRSKTRWRNAP